jgi:hypothetical protein
MAKDRFLKRSPLIAAAALTTAAGLFTMAAPAQALPPAPLAPAGCAQWGFPGETTFTNAGGVAMRFTSTGPTASGPAEFNPNGIFKRGTIAGGIDANGHVTLTFTDDDVNDPGTAGFIGDVGPDGKVKSTNTNWTVIQPFTCITQAEVKGPSIALAPGFGSLVIHITDHSGVTSQCQYNSDFVNRSFRLEKNSTFDINVVPAVPLGIDHQVDITCDNGAETHQSVLF